MLTKCRRERDHQGFLLRMQEEERSMFELLEELNSEKIPMIVVAPQAKDLVEDIGEVQRKSKVAVKYYQEVRKEDHQSH